MAVLSRGYNAENVPIEPGIMYVFNKRMQIWQRLRIPGAVPWVRSFGTCIAGIAAEPDREGMRESPGRLQRIVTPLKNGARQDLTVDHVFQSSGTYFPGELFLYNSETGRMYNIHTRQGDSEVLLVANDTLFYRVNDSIFRVRTGVTERGEQTRIVTDQPVAGNHWALFGPAEASASPASR